MKLKSLVKSRISEILFVCILCAGVLVRICGLGSLPGGLNQDEAFAGYEAYSLLHYGTDSSGYHMPVYFNSWGSGMNVLNSYLMIPFIALFGAEAWVIRLPQCITACFSLWVIYLLLKKTGDRKLALTGMFYMAVCPWHIMLSRWGLESNLAPGFILFGLYFFVLGTENSKYYMLSALFYGLSLYAYATIWPILPVILIMQAGYLVYMKKIRPDRFVAAGVLILAVLAFPLMLFLLVNKGYMNPVETSFFSIPKMTVMRDSEISFSAIPENFKNMMKILYQQNDGLYWNSTAEFGLYYKGGTFLAAAGILICFYRFAVNIKTRTFSAGDLIIPTFIGGVLTGCLIHVNVNRFNIIHISMIIFIAVGLKTILEQLSSVYRYSFHAAAVIYMTVFFCFVGFYTTEYRENISAYFQEGVEEAVETAAEVSGGNRPVCIDSRFYYPKVLLYSRMPVTEYTETVEYSNYPSAFLDVSRCGNFYFGNYSFDPGYVYIVPPERISEVSGAEWEVKEFGSAAVVYVP